MTEADVPAGLTFVSDTEPGIRRKKTKTGFRYETPDGKPLKDSGTLARIKSLVIPPAWTDVWICPARDGHLQATGRDARGRKQYRYHVRWREVRDEAKFERTLAFAKALPALRARLDVDMNQPGLSRDKVLATVVRLLELTRIRVGNEEYRKANNSFGLTTLRNRHVAVGGGELRFEFRGKSGKQHIVSLHDRRLAGIVRRCQEIKGQQLFQYLDEEGERHQIASNDVNAYLHEAMGGDFTAKDFRTWAGTVLAAMALCDFEPFETETEGKHNVVRAIEVAAAALGNTVAICRKSYVHPAVIESYLEGDLPRSLGRIARTTASASGSNGLSAEEKAVVRLLRSAGKSASSGVQHSRQRRRNPAPRRGANTRI